MLTSICREEPFLSRSIAKTRHLRREAPLPWSYVVLAGVCLLALVGLGVWQRGAGESQRPVASKLKAADIPFNGDRAYGYLKEICAIGPRVSGTEGMLRQQ